MAESDAHPPADTSERVSAELLLAAIERAALHQARDTDAVPLWSILEHLAVTPRSAAARQVRAQLAVMEDGGWLQRSRRHGVPTWALTEMGSCRLRRAQHSGELGELPESPQHRAWRAARTTADQEIERFRRRLDEHLQHGAALLYAAPPTPSDAWFELAEELQRACRRLGSSSYCLREWSEPDDARADVDECFDPGDAQLDEDERVRRRTRRAGRRNVRLWGDEPAR